MKSLGFTKQLSRRLTAGIMKGTPCVFAVLLSLLLAASHAAPGEMGPPPGQSPPHPPPTTEAAMPSPPTFNDGNVHVLCKSVYRRLIVTVVFYKNERFSKMRAANFDPPKQEEDRMVASRQLSK